jgi:glycosyltransferase involved in cell wall biosynthesis
MRITLIGINYAPEITGIAPYTTGMAEGMATKGHDITVITGFPHYPEWRVAEPYRGMHRLTEEINGVTVRRVKHYVPEHPTAVGRILLEASFARKATLGPWAKPDVVVVVSPALLSAVTVVARARLHRVPVGVIVQDVYSKGVVETGAMNGRSASFTAFLEASTLRGASSVTAIHGRLAEALADIGVHRNRTTVIRNWTHIESEIGGSHAAAVRQKFGWAPDESIVLHAGNMGAKQGLENVIAAARLASRAEVGGRVRFVLVGDGNQRRMLEELASDVSAVQLINPLPEPEFRAVLDSADILLVNERPGVGAMAVPSKLTTYFMAGKPVLAATDATSGTASELAASRAGVVVPPGDPQALLAAAEDMATGGEGEALGNNGRRYALEVLSASSAIGAYEEWCTNMVASRAPNTAKSV